MRFWYLLSFLTTLTVVLVVLGMLLIGRELKEALIVLLLALAIKLPVFCFCQRKEEK